MSVFPCPRSCENSKQNSRLLVEMALSSPARHTLLSGGSPRGDFLCANVFEKNIGRGVMPLENDGAFFQSETAAGIAVGLTSIAPVGDLISVYPYANVRPGSDNCLGKPSLVDGVHASRIRAAKNSSCAAIERLRRIIVFE